MRWDIILSVGASVILMSTFAAACTGHLQRWLKGWKKDGPVPCVFCSQSGTLWIPDNNGPNYKLAPHGFPEWGIFENKKAIHWIKRGAGYGDNDVNYDYAYHPHCIKQVICKPEDHGHNKVDLALEILNRVELEQKKAEKDEVERIRQAMVKKAKVKEVCGKVNRGDILLD